MSKNFNLTEDRFNQLRDQLRSGNEELFEQIFLTHFEDCKSFLIKKYNCRPEDAYDASMETMLVFRKKIIEGKIVHDNLRFLFTRMAGQTLIRDLKQRKKEHNLGNQIQPDQQEETKDYTVLNKAWDKLGEDCKYLLKNFYYNQIPLKEIAEHTDGSYAAIRKQKERCIHRLRQLFKQYTETHN